MSNTAKIYFTGCGLLTLAAASTGGLTAACAMAGAALLVYEVGRATVEFDL